MSKAKPEKVRPTSRSENPVPLKAYRVTLTLKTRAPRLDQVLLEALRAQKDDLELRNITRTAFKELFSKKRVRIKGQVAKPASAVAAGVTEVDILGLVVG